MSTSVLVLTNAYPDFEDSYHGIFVRRTVEELAEHGWRCHVLAPRVYKQSKTEELLPTHTVKRFRFPTANKLLIEYDSIPVFRIGMLVSSGLWSTLRTILAQDCRLIHAHWAIPSGLIAMAAARLSGLPLLLTIHGSDWRMAASQGGVVRRLFLSVASASGRIVSVSSEISDWLSSNGVDTAKTHTWPVGVDLDIFGGTNNIDWTERDTLSVISTRNLSEMYRVGDLLEAIGKAQSKISDIKLTLAGDGPLRDELVNRANVLGLTDDTKFMGRMNQNELAGLLGTSRVYVSTSPVEGTSISLLEAMASGCLPVVTDIPANRDWITFGQNGLLFEPGNTDSLADCIVQALRNEALQKAANSTGPSIVAERGSFAGHVELTDRMYRELI